MRCVVLFTMGRLHVSQIRICDNLAIFVKGTFRLYLIGMGRIKLTNISIVLCIYINNTI